MDFTVTLSNDDWDAVKGGWRCPALQIPGAAVEALYVDGTASDPKLYDVNKGLCLVRWSLPTRPKQASVHIRATKALSTAELTLKWKKLAIVLPVAASDLGVLITSKVLTIPAAAMAAEASTAGTGSQFFLQSNDFLAAGGTLQLPELLSRAKREVWFVGTTFFITTDQYRDQILDKLRSGVDVNFLILNPEGDALKRAAHLLGVTEAELRGSCLSGIRSLSRIAEDAQTERTSGRLSVKVVSEPLQTRLYFFDPLGTTGYTYYVPQLNGTNSQKLPGFLIENAKVPYHATYFSGTQRMWNDPQAEMLSAWRARHPEKP